MDFLCIGDRMEDMTHTNKKGFTLIELLIVIGILAILATAVILILNPVQLFKQARDSQRISDLATMKSALAFYLSTVSSPSLGTAATCYAYQSAGVALPADCDLRHTASAEVYSAALSVGDGIGGSLGWIPVDFGKVPGGAPLSVLPRDPQSGAGRFYSFVSNGSSTFELNADMESDRYQCGGSDDVEKTDGGDKPLAVDPCPADQTDSVYEVGNDPGLNL